jgi:hypothetical protein
MVADRCVATNARSIAPSRATVFYARFGLTKHSGVPLNDPASASGVESAPLSDTNIVCYVIIRELKGKGVPVLN